MDDTAVYDTMRISNLYTPWCVNTCDFRLRSCLEAQVETSILVQTIYSSHSHCLLWNRCLLFLRIICMTSTCRIKCIAFTSSRSIESFSTQASCHRLSICLELLYFAQLLWAYKCVLGCTTAAADCQRWTCVISINITLVTHVTLVEYSIRKIRRVYVRLCWYGISMSTFKRAWSTRALHWYLQFSSNAL